VSQYREEVERAGKLADGGEPDAAMEICNKVLLDEPDNPGALYVVGTVLLHSARHAQAIQIAKRLTEIRPKGPLGWSLLTALYCELHRYDESIRYAEKALACRRDAKTLADMGYAHVNAGNWEIGAGYAQEALKLAKGDDSQRAREAARDSLIHLVYCQLATKNWKSGFEGYRLTMRTKWRKEWTYGDSQEWQGEPDAVVMVTGEQGLGDEIMAASVVPDAANACKRFILDCDHRLGALFQRSFPNVVVTPTRRSDTVYLDPEKTSAPTHHKSLFGLSELFRREDADFPRKPFLVPNPDYVRMFRGLFDGKRTIGLAWSGGFPRTGLEPRTAGLNAFLPLLRREQAQFVSLQYKDDSREVEEFAKAHGISLIRLPWVTGQGSDCDLLAGLIAALDEVVGVHTSALHVSSALGVPTMILTHRGSGWRYGPDELLWYPPTTKLHKKRTGESWRECVGRLVEDRK